MSDGTTGSWTQRTGYGTVAGGAPFRGVLIVSCLYNRIGCTCLCSRCSTCELVNPLLLGSQGPGSSFLQPKAWSRSRPRSRHRDQGFVDRVCERVT